MLAIDTQTSRRNASQHEAAPVANAPGYFEERKAAAERFSGRFEANAIGASTARMLSALQGLIENTDFSDAGRLGQVASRIMGDMISRGVQELPSKLQGIVDHLWDFSPSALAQIRPETGVDILKALYDAAVSKDEKEASPFVASMQRLAVTLNNCPDYQREYERPRFNAFMSKMEMDQGIETFLRRSFTGNEPDLRAFAGRFVDLYREAYQLPEIVLRFGRLEGNTIGQASQQNFGITLDTSEGKIQDWAKLGGALIHELRHLNQTALQAAAVKAAGHAVPPWAAALSIDPKFHAQGMLNGLCAACYTLKDDGLESGARGYSFSLLERDAEAGRHYVRAALGG